MCCTCCYAYVFPLLFLFSLMLTIVFRDFKCQINHTAPVQPAQLNRVDLLSTMSVSLHELTVTSTCSALTDTWTPH